MFKNSKTILAKFLIANILFSLVFLSFQPVFSQDIENKSYIESAFSQTGKISRWEKSPITVFIPKTKYYNSMTNAFLTWENNSSSLIVFSFTDKEQFADIKVIFVDKLPKNIAALTNTNKQNNKLINANIYLIKPNKNTNPKDIELLLTHEIGHALGLIGHSGDKKDIMYFSPGVSTLSDSDKETIKQLYSIKNFNLKIKENKTIPLDNPVALLNKADSIRLSGDYDNAIVEYNNIISKYIDFYPALYSLALCYIKKNDYAKAYLYLDEALKLDSKNTVYLYSLAKISKKANKIPQTKLLYNEFLKRNPWLKKDKYTIQANKILQNNFSKTELIDSKKK